MGFATILVDHFVVSYFGDLYNFVMVYTKEESRKNLGLNSSSAEVL